MNSGIRVFFAGDFCSKPSTARIKVDDALTGTIRSCDYAVVNFEVPLKPDSVTLKAQKRERFFQNDDAPQFLKDVGFNLFQTANNHLFDWGEAGYKKTFEALGSETFGAGSYDDAYKVKIVEKDGVRVGLLALCFAAYAGVFNDRKNGLGCAYINDLRVNHDIIEAKKQVDYLIVLPHSGIEYIDIPLPETIARYRDFIDYGADAVMGTHPHCPQGWEEYKGRPIFYSLGNFLFNSKDGYDYRANNRPHWYEGLCVVLEMASGSLRWQVINTRNVDNTGLVIDSEASRKEHNEYLCKLLSDEQSYKKCINSVCETLGQQELAIVDTTLHASRLKQSTAALLKYWKARLLRRKYGSDYALQRLLAHDDRRHLLELTLRNNEK